MPHAIEMHAGCMQACMHDGICRSLWRRHGGEWRGPDPPTSVQTPLGISANPLKSFFTYRGGGSPCMYIVTFTAHQQRNMVRTPPLFWGWRRHWARRLQDAATCMLQHAGGCTLQQQHACNLHAGCMQPALRFKCSRLR